MIKEAKANEYLEYLKYLENNDDAWTRIYVALMARIQLARIQLYARQRQILRKRDHGQRRQRQIIRKRDHGQRHAILATLADTWQTLW